MNNNCNKFIELLKEIQEKKSEGDLLKFFTRVADRLFKEMAIKAGETTFTFAEIEFYYYKKDVFEGPMYNCTYPRTKHAGQFFWHYSGMDICFESNEEDRCFGGILIRSIKKDGEIIAGPMRCSDEIMNSCKGEMPCLIENKTHVGEIEQTNRYGIKADETDNKTDMKLRYYIKRDSWYRKRNGVLVADQTTGGYKEVSKTDYYTAQP
jgi:3-methyladenine DNA glycosylase Mpg